MPETQQSGPACALGPLWWPTVAAPGREKSGAENVCGWNVTGEERQLEVVPATAGVNDDLGGIDLGKDPV